MNNTLINLLRKHWPAVCWAAVIFVLISLPGNYFPRVFTFWNWLAPDKIVHAAIFGVFVFLLLWGGNAQRLAKEGYLKTVALSLAIGAFYGGLTEALQYYFFVGRNGNIFDFFANTIGCIAGYMVFHLTCRLNYMPGRKSPGM